MKQLAVNFFLSCCILLLNGYGGLQAHHFANGHSSSQDNGGLVYAGFLASQHSEVFHTRFVSIGTENSNNRFHVSPYENVEDDVDELTSMRKRLESSSYSTIFLINVFNGFISEPRVNPTPFLASAESDRYLVLQVFRI